MSSEEKTRIRINSILNLLKELEKKSLKGDKKKIIAEMMFKGISRRNAVDYINCLIISERVIEKEGFLEINKNENNLSQMQE